VYHPAVRLILASASPRRAELLTAAGYTFDVVPVDVDEMPEARETPLDYVRRVAVDKARASRLAGSGAIVLAADTTVAIDGVILGKPDDPADASRMLRMLSGREHLVHTAVAVRGGRAADSHGPDTTVEVATTRVRFLQMSAAEIDWYVASGEPDGKAGAYAIQGRASRFVEWLEGSYSNVVGLPVHLVHLLLGQRGHLR
jgi:septum formation protein